MYSLLASLPLLEKSYALKTIIIAIIGILMPILTLTAYLMITAPSNIREYLDIYIVVFLGSIFGMLITSFALHFIVEPIRIIATDLQKYLNNDKYIIKLPIGIKDSVGQIMTHTQYLIEKITTLKYAVDSTALIDPLTGVLNHKAGIERLQQDISRACREKNHMLIALLDIIQLEEINKEIGNYFGDVCLTQTVEMLNSSIREGDWLARWKNDQFLMILWNIQNTEPNIVLKRIQQTSVKTSETGGLLKLNFNISAYEYKGTMESNVKKQTNLLMERLEKALIKANKTKKGGITIIK
ncbi:MAG: diguanylate cyclase [Thiomargarita sp.]|nr:diguanylate cyclase [Thiomargarita sp.]